MTQRARQRVLVLGIVVLSLVVTLLGRLWYLQVLSGPTYKNIAVANDVQTVSTPAPRGMIVDDEGRVLASNKYAYVVTVSTSTLNKQSDGGKGVLHRLAPVIGLSYTQLADKLRPCTAKVSQPCDAGSPFQPVDVQDIALDDNAALQKAFVIQERAELFHGVAIAERPVRQYPYDALAAQDIGYLNTISSTQLQQPAYAGDSPTQQVGQTGLEAQYNTALQGRPSTQKLSVDARGDVTGTISTTQPQTGDTLVTNIDAGLQKDVENELEAGIASARSQGNLGTTAAAVVMDPNSGAVLALASAPSYNLNEWTGGISQAQIDALQAPDASAPLLSRAYSAEFPPGSTFKASSSAAILQNGLTTPNTLTACPSGFPIGTGQDGILHNFEGEAEAPLTITTALKVSCDTFFYKYAFEEWQADGGLRTTAAEKALPDKQLFYKMASAFGYGKRTGVDLPDEDSGTILDRQSFATEAEYYYKQACAGAKAHPDDPAREAQDAAVCAQGPDLYEPGQAAEFAIGQGAVDVTLLQQAVAYSAVANGGTLYEPRVGKALLSSTTGKVVQQIKPVVRGKVPVSQANLDVIKEGLREVVQEQGGTAYGAGFDASLDVAGKTGTADVAQTGVLANEPESWFMSMQPVSHPRYVVAVMVEHGGQGGIAAAQVSANIYKDIYGLDGHAAVWPNGIRPGAGQLPTVTSTGTTSPPQQHLPGVTAQAPLPPGDPDPNAVALAEQNLAEQQAAAEQRKKQAQQPSIPSVGATPPLAGLTPGKGT